MPLTFTGETTKDPDTFRELRKAKDQDCAQVTVSISQEVIKDFADKIEDVASKKYDAEVSDEKGRLTVNSDDILKYVND